MESPNIGDIVSYAGSEYEIIGVCCNAITVLIALLNIAIPIQSVLDFCWMNGDKKRSSKIGANLKGI